MRNIILLLSLICLIFIVVFILRQQTNKNVSKESIFYMQHLDKLENSLKFSLDNNELFLSDTLNLRNNRGDSVSIKDVAAKYCMVFRYTSMNCSACVHEEFKTIRQIVDRADNPESVCFFVTEYAKREVNIHLKSLGINCPVYFTDQIDIGISVDKQGLPYYFHLNPDLRISNVFVPVTWNHELSEFYLQTMLSRK